MIIGIGMDIVKVERIEKAITRYGDRFKNKIFNIVEREYCERQSQSGASYAARFAVKEAVFKALGRGCYDCGGYTSVEVGPDERGKPEVFLHSKAAEFSEQLGVSRIFVTITHDAGISAAVVIMEK